MVKKVECTFARLTFLKTGGSQFESFISMISREKPSYLSLSTPSQSRENTSKHGLILQWCAFGFDLSCISMMISYGSKQCYFQSSSHKSGYKWQAGWPCRIQMQM